MGRTHALSGAAGLLAVVPVLAGSHLRGLAPGGPVGITAAAVAAGGAALLADIDHPDATVSTVFGPVSGAVCGAVTTVLGGHRSATHSLLFAGLAGVGGYAAGLAGGWTAWAVVAVLGVAGLAAVEVPTLTGIAAVVPLCAVAASYGVPAGWLGPAVTLGALAHLAGDCITGHGCPLAWPFGRHVGVGLVDTGGRFEHHLLTPVLAVGVALLGARLAGIWP